MKAKRFVLEFLRVVVVLAIFFVLAFAGFNFAQGPEGMYDVGNGYKIIGWPGPIDRWNIGPGECQVDEVPYHDKVIEENVSAFYVDDVWVAGRTRKGWFAINKDSGQVHYPYESKEELARVSGFSLAEKKLIARYPFEYEVIHAPAKKFLAVMIPLGIVAVIGFRRSLRIFQAIPKALSRQAAE
jgi:hypothetical protein